MNSSISFNKPAFSGLTIDDKIPARLRKAIRQNPIIRVKAQNADLKFSVVTEKTKDSIQLLFCDVLPKKTTILDYIFPFKQIFGGEEIFLGSSKSGFAEARKTLKRMATRQVDFN